MPTRIGFNTHKRTSGYVEMLQKNPPKATLVMNDLGLAHELTHALPNSIIIYRDWSLGDDRHARMQPDHFANICRNQSNGQPNLWFYTTNEVGFDLANLSWHSWLMGHATDLKFVGMNPAVGTYPDSVAGWAFAEGFLRQMSLYRDRFILGLHEYACVLPVSGMPNFPARIQDWSGAMFPAYHVGRFRWLEQFCESKDFKPPRMIVTEHGYDDLQDIHAFTSQFWADLPYTSIRGWKSMHSLWSHWYSKRGWSPDKAYFESIKWLDQHVYAKSAVEAQLIYCWGYVNSEWEQFDVSESKEFRELWQGYTLDPSGAGHPAIQGRYTVNVRFAPDVSSGKVGVLRPGDKFSTRMQMDTKKEWISLTLENGVEGWSSLKFLRPMYV